MQDFLDTAEAHAWTLQRLREMAGRLTEQAYLKAMKAAGGATLEDDEAHARWMLVFDRMARGLRLSIALEAKLSRERRVDAARLRDEIEGGDRRPSGAPRAPADEEAEPCESDRERDDDGLPDDAPLGQRIARLRTIIEGVAEAPAPTVRFRFEDIALRPQREQRARLAGSDAPPDEPWDLLTDEDRADAAAPDWRGSG
jgi:hypothetical protein